MVAKRTVLVGLLLYATVPISAQQRVDPRTTYERILAVTPIVGKGTPSDPRRPLYTPAGADRGGIIGFSWLPSEDGRVALVELVARDRTALRAILAERRPDVKLFEKSKARREEIEAEFKKYKSSFDWEKLGVQVR